MKVLDNLKYTKDHEWVSIDDNIATVGITDFAQSELGDIVYIEVETLDENLSKDEVFGTVEAVKTVSDLFLPMSGKIIEFNEALDDNPELVNDSPYDEGWIIKVEISNMDEISQLLDSKSYGVPLKKTLLKRPRLDSKSSTNLSRAEMKTSSGSFVSQKLL